ncbi:uncharacterized protein with beta-barrel porin domain [Brevundimonas alba]|uniref:Uncharacterized protein with beta-barrel porin domain n=1 Tax=Brevundimonas alba TaxID=74314 RepID=A0A7X5YKQ8_9CAUL|nr:autotransporter domain-containing protein [Brevundimonas alba]NJC41711.1 uncharacterized protein with beta-barrel porin domain [Brevundimonas alba]
MVAIAYQARNLPSISVYSAKAATRRDLSQQASRVVLMSAIGLAAVAGGGLMAPGQALADCLLVANAVQCGTTSTINTSYPVGSPSARAYQFLSGPPLSGTVSNGAVAGGHGLAFTNLGDGGVSVVNNGMITVDAGNTPTEGGTAALSMTANGGVLTYTGGAVTNYGTGNGLDATQNGADDNIEISLTAAVRGSTGILAVNNGAGNVSITAGAPVTGMIGSGIFAESRGGGISIAAGDVSGQTGAGILAQLLSAPASTNGVSIIADSVLGRTGITASNSGLGVLSVTTTGDVTGSIGSGLDLASAGAIDVNIGGSVTGGQQGILVQGASDIRVTGTGFTSLSGNAVQIVNNGAGAVDFEATGPITAIDGDGINVRDTAIGGDISIITGDVAALSAGYDGIDVYSTSLTADIEVVVAGDVSAGRIGVFARIGDGAGDINLRTGGSVTGTGGIYATTNGAGSISVTAAGPVTASIDNGIFANSNGGAITIIAGDASGGNGYDGIYAKQQNLAGAGDVLIVAGSASGENGIVAINNGSGDVSVTAGGPVTGYGEDGVQVSGLDAISVNTDAVVTGVNSGLTVNREFGGTGDISVSGAGFTALAGNAVDIYNQGAGAVDFVSTGPITATNGYGLVVNDTAIGGDIRITTGSVTAETAGYSGIYVQSNSTTADIEVTTNGDVRASNYGIDVSTAVGSSGNIDVTANASVSAAGGIFAVAQGAGSVNVTTVGAVTAGTEFGIHAAAEQGGNVTVDAGSVTTEGEAGISAYAAGGDGVIDVTAGTISGDNGITAFNEGTGATVIRTSGTIRGTADAGIGVLAYGSVSVAVADTVTGQDAGLEIDLLGGGSGDISVTGAGGFVALDGYGIDIENNGSGEVNVDISGAIVATNGNGIYVVNDTADSSDLSITTGDVSAISDGYYGIEAFSLSATGNVSVTSNGDIAAGEGGISAFMSSGGTGDVSVTAFGSVSGDLGIFAGNFGSGDTSVAATGTISATTGEGILARSQGGGDITITAGSVVSTEGIGVFAWQEDVAGAGDIDITTTGALSGGQHGIVAVNAGTGAVHINTTGAVTGAADAGIAVGAAGAASIEIGGPVTGRTNGVVVEGAGDISLTGAGSITSRGGAGVEIQGDGAGTVTYDVAGRVRATGGNGVQVTDTAVGGDITVTTGAVEAMSNGYYGILIGSSSTAADVRVIANGPIVAAEGGIRVSLEDASATGNISVTAHGPITGDYGVFAENRASGSTAVTATGPITAGAIGILARSNGDDVTVTAGDVASGGDFGIVAELGSNGAGDVRVTAHNVSGATAISAINDGVGLVSVDLNGSVVADGEFGIVARSGGGDVSVNASDVAGSAEVGIAAVQAESSGAGDIFVAAGSVTGGVGIVTSNAGTGETRITTTGAVVGSVLGIHSVASADAGNITLDVANVSGAVAGVAVDNVGVGVTDLTVRGLVQGGDLAVAIYSDADQQVRISNEGVIRSSAGLSSDRAIEAAGGGIDFTNTGVLVGDIVFQGDSSLFENRGSWSTGGGDSTFAGLDDDLINAATGSILAGSSAEMQDITFWRGLETFRNEGRVTLGDNGAGDVIMTSANAVFAAGSQLQVDIGGQGGADLFLTTGTLMLNPGARLDVNFVQPLALGGRYVVARADGGLTGTFDFEDRYLSAFVGMRDGYTATTAYIDVAQLRALIEAGLTPNQRETAAGADSLAQTNPLKAALLLLPDDAAARDAFDQLSGEIHPATRGAMADDSRLFRNAVLGRLAADRAEGAWAQALLDDRRVDGDGNAAETKRDTRGLMFGADRALNTSVTVGLAGGWFDTDVDVSGRASSAENHSLQALGYLGAQVDRWHIRAGIGFASSSLETQRQVSVPGFNASPVAAYKGSAEQAFLEAGYRLPMGGGYVEPFIGVTAIASETEAFTETGGAQGSIIAEAVTDNLVATTLGARFDTGMDGPFSLRGMAGYRGMDGDLAPVGRHAFAGGESFTVLGTANSDIAAIANLEARWSVTSTATVSASWEGVFGNKGEDHAITGRLKIAF